MRVDRELTIFGEPDAIDGFIPLIESRLTDGWFRDRESEPRLHLSSRDRAYCFVCRAQADRPELAVVMNLEGCRLSVVNIVPNGGSLSRDLCNLILAEFCLRFIYPVPPETQVTIDLSSDERSLEEVIGWRPTDLLRRFSGCANKAATHPADERRFFDFIIAVYDRSGCRCDVDLLAKWLVEDGWSAEKARKLIGECEDGLGLLRELDRKGRLIRCRPIPEYDSTD